MYCVLDDVCISCIASVGVDLNSATVDLLRKVPGLTKKGLAEKVVSHRPFEKLKDLLNVPGLGEKAFENAAGFCRIVGGKVSDRQRVIWMYVC